MTAMSTEQPAEDDPDEALADLIWAVVDNAEGKWVSGAERDEFITRCTALAIARAAREHIEQEIPEELDKIGITWQSRARRMGKRAEKAEGERDWWRDWWRDELAERWGKSDVDEQTTRFEEAATAMRAEVKDHDATRARAEKAEAERDEWKDHAEKVETDRSRIVAERDEWKARHAALRADVEMVAGGISNHYGRGLVRDVLDRDAERGGRDDAR